VFRSTGAESVVKDDGALHGNLTLCGQTRPVTVHVTPKDGRYSGEIIVKQTDFGIKPPGKAGVRAKDEVRIEFDVGLVPQDARGLSSRMFPESVLMVSRVRTGHPQGRASSKAITITPICRLFPWV
jgi:YceI-like domain